jgi:carbon-monoxide dehydrogenase large subunit
VSASIGEPVPRLEDQALLTGKGRYVDDIVSPGVLHAAFVRSPHAHALIRNVDAASARALPGVHAVFTIEELAAALTRRRMTRISNSGSKLDQSWPFVLADGEVSYVGEPVAIVVADSRYIAEDTAATVEVEYEVLPAAADCRAAAQRGAVPVRRELAANQIMSYRVDYGDVDAAFAHAAHVFRDELWIHRGGAHSIEGRGILAEVSDRAIAVWASTQKAHDLFHALADLLDLNENCLRVATPDVGGGFGPKLCTYPEDVAVVAAAKLLCRSVKWIEDRREHFTNAVQERDQFWSLEIAVDADARVRGLRGRILHDVGAYAMQDVNLPYNSATSVSGPYMMPALTMDVVVAHTNKTPVSSVRGAGYPQAAFAIERMLDRVARELKLDRAEVRRRNLIPAEKMPYQKPLKARSGEPIAYDSGDYPGCQAEVLKTAGWDEFSRRQQAARAAGRYLGIGLAHGLKGTGRGPFEFGAVRVSPSGRISVFTGAAAMGQGLGTALAQICAEQFGVRPQDVTVVAGDTSAASLGLGGFASRQTVTAGSSVHIAAKAVTAKARKLASHLLEAAEDDLEIADGEVRVVGAPQLAVKLSELARILKGAPGYGFPPGIEPGLEANATFRTDALAYSNGCHVVEVEVDIETGAVHILRYVAIQDSGRRINPLIVEGQVHGGICHGIGNAMFEWMGYDNGGQPITTTFADYLLATATELPRFETRYKESPSPNNPLGVKGVGEVGVIPAAAAVISAIEDALEPFGVRISQMPVTPHKLMELIAQGRDRLSAPGDRSAVLG